MNLTRLQRNDLWRSPFDRLTHLHDEINRLFEAPFDALAADTELSAGWTPALDVYEDKNNLLVKVELPGMKKEDLQLSLHENTLTLSGERKPAYPEGEVQTSRTERYFGRFQRTVTLPKPVDAGKVSARYQDGILTVTLPKTEECKPKEIEVTAS